MAWSQGPCLERRSRNILFAWVKNTNRFNREKADFTCRISRPRDRGVDAKGGDAHLGPDKVGQKARTGSVFSNTGSPRRTGRGPFLARRPVFPGHFRGHEQNIGKIGHAHDSVPGPRFCSTGPGSVRRSGQGLFGHGKKGFSRIRKCGGQICAIRRFSSGESRRIKVCARLWELARLMWAICCAGPEKRLCFVLVQTGPAFVFSPGSTPASGPRCRRPSG